MYDHKNTKMYTKTIKISQSTRNEMLKMEDKNLNILLCQIINDIMNDSLNVCQNNHRYYYIH